MGRGGRIWNLEVRSWNGIRILSIDVRSWNRISVFRFPFSVFRAPVSLLLLVICHFFCIFFARCLDALEGDDFFGGERFDGFGEEFVLAVFVGKFAADKYEAIVFPRCSGLFVGAGKDDAFDFSARVFDHGKIHLLLVFEVDFFAGGNDAADGNRFLKHVVRKTVEAGGGSIEVVFVSAGRMIADVESEELPFPQEPFVFFGGWNAFEMNGGRGNVGSVEERGLFGIVLRGEEFDEIENHVHILEHFVAFGDTVEGAHFGEGFEGFFVEVAHAHAFDKIGNRCKFSSAFSLFDDGFGNGLPDIFDGVETEANNRYRRTENG